MKKEFGGGSDKVYVRLDSDQAKESKKKLLEAAAGVIKLQLTSENLKKLGQEEISRRKALKNGIRSMSLAVENILKVMPSLKEESSSEGYIKVKRKMRENSIKNSEKVSKKASLYKELMDLKNKIEELS